MAAKPVKKESYRERQKEEYQAIKAIFGNDVEDLRSLDGRDGAPNSWKPLDCRIYLTPLRSSSGDDKAYASTKLHVVCSAKYPRNPPKIFLEETKGLSHALIDELLKSLEEQSTKLRGQVMIYEFAHTIQSFLLKHNKPPSGSLYDEMIQEREKREKEMLYKQEQKEIRERQHLLDEVERRKEFFKSETRRREPRRSISDSNRVPSSSDNSETSLPYRGFLYPCKDHQNSDKIVFHKAGRQIMRGCCIGHPENDCIAFSGVDVLTGQLLYITEWNIKFSRIEVKCSSGKCSWVNSEPKCAGNHRIDDLIASIEKQVANLSQLNHKNLIQYECVLCTKRKDGILVYLAQDFVFGTSVCDISSKLGWSIDGARMITRGVLEALVYLHNKGVSHRNLCDSTVFMDTAGVVRCTNYSLVPNLLELVSDLEVRSSKGDLPALGAFVESLMPTLTCEMRDFVDKCNSDRTLSASELLDHSFLRRTLFNDVKDMLPNEPKDEMNAVVRQTSKMNIGQCQRKVSDLEGGNDFKQISVEPSRPSRLHTEFEVLTYLGKGAYGDVLKVRNILDNREYAIKRIPLSERKRSLSMKMTREVELLSRLNHENVVRYFNSWIEIATDADLEEIKESSSEWSGSPQEGLMTSSPKKSQNKETVDSSSELWNIAQDDSEDSDCIQFVDSNGEEPVYEDEQDRLDIVKSISPKPVTKLMYIQMEFCEKCTLRTAIDENLSDDTERMWRLFREIAEGLAHIHQQGIIHRDLKPVNIFLDSHDQIKIGDFGLATTSFLALQSQQDHQHSSQQRVVTNDDATGTGKVGTALYVAPELTGNASKSTYDQRVDMYTLGIILFEMSQPPFQTGMERALTIRGLRNPSIDIPEHMLSDIKFEKIVKILRWLLIHDPTKRPEAETLLSSDLLPPAQLEASELQEMLRHVLENPQRKSYKNLVSRCLQQECDNVVENTYHMSVNRLIKKWNSPIGLDGIVSLNAVIEFVKTKIVGIFRKHGAIEVDTPLLTPFTEKSSRRSNPVKLMTHSGCVVVLPNDLRSQFAQHIAMSGTNAIRRYSIARIYQEEKVFNYHPKQIYECAFDIVTPSVGNHLIDAEILCVAYELINEIPQMRDLDIYIHINHANLVRSMLHYWNIHQSLCGELYANVLELSEKRISKLQFNSWFYTMMDKSKSSAASLTDFLLSEFSVAATKANDPVLRSLFRGKGEASSLALGAFRDLESIASLARCLGVNCPIYVCPGVPINVETAKSGEIAWRMIVDLKGSKDTKSLVLAIGERYDTMLMDFQKQAHSFNANIPIRSVSGAGMSFLLDKLIATIGPDLVDKCRTIDVGVCVIGTRPPLKDVAYILHMLWSVGLRCGVIEASCEGDEALDFARLGALHVILVSENGALRVCSRERDRFQERQVTLSELVDYIQKLLRNDDNNSVDTSQTSTSSINTSASNISIKNSITLPNVQVVFLMQEKISSNLRRRQENQVLQQMNKTLSHFGKKENCTVFVVDFPKNILNAIAGAINPRETDRKETDKEITIVIERFPRIRRQISEVIDHITNHLQNNKTSIVALYSILDSYYRVMI